VNLALASSGRLTRIRGQIISSIDGLMAALNLELMSGGTMRVQVVRHPSWDEAMFLQY